MKWVLLVAVCVVLAVPAFAEPDVAAEEDKELQSVCPFTLISSENSCTTCHEVKKSGDGYKWAVKEAEWRGLPFGTRVVKRGGEDCLYYLLEDINASKMFDIYEYCQREGIKQVEIEINSPGGSVVSAWRIIAMMQSYPEIHTTTKCYGMAASAGFILLASGDKRIASPRAMLMAHELWTLKFLSIETPAMSKDEAEIMDLWQTNINEWLVEKSKMTLEEIQSKIHKRDWWMIGKTAHELGFIDELSWGK